MSNLPPLKLADVEPLLDQHTSWVSLAHQLKYPVSTVKGFAQRHGLVLADGSVSRAVSSDDPAEWDDLEGLIRSRHLSPDDWQIDRARVNTWGVDGVACSQLRVDLTPRRSLLVPARSEGWIPPPPKRRKPVKGVPELVAFFGDHHCPYHDPLLHEATCVWLAEHKPARAIILGDLIDADSVSRHRFNPMFASTLQENLDSAYALLAAYRRASPDTAFTLLPGNHDDRLRLAVIDNFRPALGLRRGGLPEDDPVLSLQFLLRLDELSIDFVESPSGGYETAQVLVTDSLAARHGWIASKGSGSSALKTLRHLMHSVVVGHTHRQSVVHATISDIHNDQSTISACEAGTMALVRDGLGYANAPDWQAGFATAHVFGDTFSLMLARWESNRLVWGGWSHCSS